MRLFNDAKSFASRENAITKLDKTLAKAGLQLGNVRWFVAVTDDERFVPVVKLHSEILHLALPLASQGVSVIN